jgi:hypothetical protein
LDVDVYDGKDLLRKAGKRQEPRSKYPSANFREFPPIKSLNHEEYEDHRGNLA